MVVFVVVFVDKAEMIFHCSIILFLFVCLLFSVLGMKFRSLSMLGQCSTVELYPQSCFLSFLKKNGKYF